MARGSQLHLESQKGVGTGKRIPLRMGKKGGRKRGRKR